MAKLTKDQWNEILSKVKSGEKVTDLAQIYGISPKSIYNKAGTISETDNSLLEINRLKQDSRPFTNYLKIYEANIKNNDDKDKALKEYLCEAFALYMGVNLPNPNETDDSKPELVNHIEKLTKSVTLMHN